MTSFVIPHTFVHLKKKQFGNALAAIYFSKTFNERKN
jgi:hypothetical protein